MKKNLRQKSGGANGSSHGRGCCSHATTWVAQKAASDKWRKGHQSNSRGFFCQLCQLISIYFPCAGSWEEAWEALEDLQLILSQRRRL